MDDRWLRLLVYWQDHEFKHSLTFPFLIGALRIPIGATKGYANTARKELEELIDAIRSYAASNFILHVYRCGDRDKLVLTRVHGTSAPPYSVAIPQYSGASTPVLFASDSSVKNTAPMESLIAAIWHESGTAIERGLFSCRGKLFQPFDDYELNVIRAALY